MVVPQAQSVGLLEAGLRNRNLLSVAQNKHPASTAHVADDDIAILGNCQLGMAPADGAMGEKEIAIFPSSNNESFGRCAHSFPEKLKPVWLAKSRDSGVFQNNPMATNANTQTEKKGHPLGSMNTFRGLEELPCVTPASRSLGFRFFASPAVALRAYG